MALSKTITQLRPKLGDRNIYTFGFHLLVQDGGFTVIDRDITTTCSENADVSTTKKELKEIAQALIDDYKKEAGMRINQKYIDIVSEINSELNL